MGKVQQMEAGHALDVMVAMEVMGLEHREWAPYAAPEGWFPKDHPDCCPKSENGFIPHGHNHPSEIPYSTDLEAAWEVVEKIKHLKPDNEPEESFEMGWTKNGWWVGWSIPTDEGDTCYTSALAPTAPEAICLAALKAIGKVAE